MPVRDGEQCSIGFQPVPRDHCTWLCEIGNDLGVPQSRRSIGARYRLEAYATLSVAASLNPSFPHQCAAGEGVTEGCFDWSSPDFGGFIFFN
jgi:hypothetical protein